MRIAEKTRKSFIFILIVCLALTMALGTMETNDAYAAVSELVFTPSETADDILNGIDVPVKSSYQGLIEYNILSGGTVYKGSGECWGYAEKIRKMFGSGGGRKTSVKKKNTPENLYNALKNVKPGTHVRFGDSNSGDGHHSIVVYKVTEDKIYFSDANVAGRNVIRHMEVGINFFSKYAYILWYIQPSGGFKVSSTKIKGFSYDLEDKIEIAWRPVAGAKSYTVYKSSSKNGKYKKIKTTKKPYYVDKNVTSRANYYKVKPNNGRMSSATCVYNKLLTPTVRVNATKAGYAKLSWDKIKDAKKYGVYIRDHSKSKGNYYKLIKTVKGTSCTYKGTEDEDVYVRAIASNSKANSQYLKVYAQRYAPQPKIIGGEADKNDGTRFIVKLQIPYDCSDHESLLINLYRSNSKDGPYSLINCVAVYGIDYDARYYKDPNQFKKNKFNKDSVIKIPDYSWRGETSYYYKAEAVKGVSNMAYEPTGLDSRIVKLTTPELPVVGEEFGTVGTLYRHTDGTLAYFVDNDGNKYTEGLELERFWEDYLEYTDNEGSKFRIYKDGRLMMYNVDSGSYEYVKEENNED